ncbi:MAG: tetratricopeptide repeat protein [Bacteroidales bacterium]|nr:tetratricopeptide repeat protein [Bacteroidales bacterium]
MSKYLYGLVMVLLVYSCSTDSTKNEQKESSTTLKKSSSQIELLNEKIKNDTINPDLFHQRSELYLQKGDYYSALKDILSALEIDSTYSTYYVTLSDVYLALGKMKKTVRALEKAIELDSDQTEAYLKLAEISVAIREYKKALTYIDIALKKDELSAKGYYLRGLVMMENGDTIRGIRNFQKSIDVQQNYMDAHIQLGMLYAEKKNKLAVDYFNNALNIEPDNIDVKYYLAMFYQENADYEKAIQTYNSILDQDPDFYIAYYNVGYIKLVFQKDFPEAINQFTKCIEIKDDYIDAYYNRGFAYELLKDVENSRKDYKKTLELLPNYEKAIDGLNRIDDYLINQTSH